MTSARLDPALCRRLAAWAASGVPSEEWIRTRDDDRHAAIAAQLTAAAEMAERIDVLERGLDGAIDIAAKWIAGSPTDFENLNLLRKIRDGWWPPTGNGPVGRLVAERDALRTRLDEIQELHARDVARWRAQLAERPALTADEVREAVRALYDDIVRHPDTFGGPESKVDAIADRVAVQLAGRVLTSNGATP